MTTNFSPGNAETMAYETDTPQYRPKIHFTPQRNWMNDPNGLVYFEGEYHLFFQFNPHGKDWGHMSWGHAVSTDLMHWTELPVAIPEGDQMIFSGCAVVDWKNTSGFGIGNEPPLLAFFTAHDPRSLIQTQHLAYSHDRGRSWLHYAGNPIIDLNLDHFRDPKVFYHDASAAWVMVVALPRAHKVQFYRSANLLDWTLSGEFGPAGGTGGQWECPDLIELSVEGDGDGTNTRKYWVLKIDIDKDFLADGSGAQYFVGDFDGHNFSVDTAVGSANGEIFDFGPDFYAAVTWSDLPDGHETPVMIGWMSNHQSGHQYPTHPWRGAQTVPRVLSLAQEDGLVRLRQRPVAALGSVMSEYRHSLTYGGDDPKQRQIAIDDGLAQIFLELPTSATGDVRITLADTESDLLTIACDFTRNELIFERCRSAQVPEERFYRTTTCALDMKEGLEFQMLVDRSLVEIFVNDGSRAYSACIFPQGPMQLTVGPD